MAVAPLRLKVKVIGQGHGWVSQVEQSLGLTSVVGSIPQGGPIKAVPFVISCSLNKRLTHSAE